MHYGIIYIIDFFIPQKCISFVSVSFRYCTLDSSIDSRHIAFILSS